MKLQVLFFIFWLIFLLSSVKHGRYTGRAESNQELDAVLVDHTDNSQQPSQFSSIISSKYEGELNLGKKIFIFKKKN